MVRYLEELGPNLRKITKRLMANQSLLKLLYYTDKDPLSQDDLTAEQIRKEVNEKLIKIVPRVGPKENAKSIVAMQVMRGSPDVQNGEFTNIRIQFEIFVPNTQWFIKSENLRPFCIMGEIQKSLNDKIINGLGRMKCGDFAIQFNTDEITCYTLTYYILNYE